MRRFVGLIAAAGIVAVGLAWAMATYGPRVLARSQPVATGAVRRGAGKDLPVSGSGMVAIAEAAKAHKYLFAMFWKTDDEPTQRMRETLTAAVKQVSAKADQVLVRITDAEQRPVVEKLGLDRAPMPLVLVLAPNGAVTGGFPSKVEEKDLLNAFATPCTEQCMKALQENKLVLVCIQNAGTKANDVALQGVREFQSDSRYNQVTEIVMLDPADDAEAAFLGDLKINPKTTEAITAFMVPPGSVVAKLTGATTKEELISALEKASSGCCPGGKCCPGGCGSQR